MHDDADRWEGMSYHDDLGGVPRTVPALEAEVQALRAVLVDVVTELDRARSWEQLRSQTRVVRKLAHHALHDGPQRLEQSPIMYGAWPPGPGPIVAPLPGPLPRGLEEGRVPPVARPEDFDPPNPKLPPRTGPGQKPGR